VLRVTLRGHGVPTAVLGSGETLLFGRSPASALPEVDAAAQLRYTALALPRCAPHVSRLLGELSVGEEMVRLRWRGSAEAQLSSLFDAPGGARRVTLVDAMSALLDEGENRLVLLRGRELPDGTFTDLTLAIDVAVEAEETGAGPAPVVDDRDASPTTVAPGLVRGTREWFVALALAEPWLSGSDDYPRPPSNREVFERVRHWHGYTWNLERPQRVDDAIRSIAGIAFGAKDDPFRRPDGGRVQNVRFAVGRRAAEVRLVTVDDLEWAEQSAAEVAARRAAD
jgi:hypothetical protein